MLSIEIFLSSPAPDINFVLQLYEIGLTWRYTHGVYKIYTNTVKRNLIVHIRYQTDRGGHHKRYIGIPRV